MSYSIGGKSQRPPGGKGYTIGRDAKSGAFRTITVPGRGEVGMISGESFKAAKEAAGYRIQGTSAGSALSQRPDKTRK
ncbi:hypothetical protein [Aureimonas leprariae]|uniref:Uncharacterized protein n=1 Tax=Plantimonas leprariae TaxID=2615207 RepID=A0A7V7PKY3_9HYPH|nr:hypothetical protein [Aureimonas leprariae]KAB0676718.1 hypothetical protein F6X38_20675 [Aureimonas leprariae]